MTQQISQIRNKQLRGRLPPAAKYTNTKDLYTINETGEEQLLEVINR